MFATARAAVVIGACVLVAACGGAAYYGTPPPQQQPPQHGYWPPATAQPYRPPVATAAAATIQPYVGVEYQDAGVNGFIDPIRDPYSTFAMDVDTASYGVARRYLDDGNLPARDSVRLEEYVNSFDYGYQPPTDNAFALGVDGAPTPYNGSRSLLLRIGIQARQVSEENRPPVSLTFVIDTSGSMAMEQRLELVKAALDLLVSRLQPNDSVAIVRFGTDASVVLQPTSAAEPDAILAAIATLSPDGSTNAEAGLELGYDLARLGHRQGALDRVVFASDGVANVGSTSAAAILARLDSEVATGIDLVAIGVGMGNFNDVLLEQLADHGNGFYAYINDRLEADRLFGSQLTGTLVTVARDARIQVEFRPDAVSRYRPLGYEDRAMADQDFRNPTADAGEVGAGYSVTALYEIEPNWQSDGFLGTVRLRWIDPDTGAEQQLARDIELSDFVGSYAAASPSFRLAATVAGFAEILRESPYVGNYDLGDVAAEAGVVAGLFEGRQDVVEFKQLTLMAARIAGY